MENIKVAHLFQSIIILFFGMMVAACGTPAVADEPSAGAKIEKEIIAFVTATSAPNTATPRPTATATATALPSQTPVRPTPTATATTAPTPSPVPPTATPRPTVPPGLYAGSGVPAFPATRIVIPALGVDTPVQLSPIVGETWDVSFLEQSVGHLEGTASPGDAGNTVLAGHVTLAPDGRAGPFHHLRDLQPGDTVTVYRGEQPFTYQIDGVGTVSPSDVQVAFPTEAARLTLITCQNYDQSLSEYTERLVVMGHLLSN